MAQEYFAGGFAHLHPPSAFYTCVLEAFTVKIIIYHNL